ncbi:MAG: EamA family transporter [Candidatus Peribacteraceae bacterium]|nr:EamA family transporter [Candidatus Peribacteraceae bacterium]
MFIRKFSRFVSGAQHHWAIIALLLSVTCSNAQPVFSKLLYADGWTPVSIYFLALLVVVIFLGIHEFLEFEEKGRWGMTREDMKGVLLTTVVGGFISPILYFTGLDKVRASDAVLLVSLTPVFTVGFAVLLLRERFNAATVWGSLFLIAGIGVLLFPNVRQAQFHAGSLLLVGASLTSALTTILHKKYVKHRHLDSVVLVRTVLSLLLIGGWMRLTEPQSFALFEAPQKMWLVLGFPIIGVLLPFFLFFGALRHVKAVEAGMVSGAGPVAGVLLAAAFLQEQIAAPQILSLALIIIGILNINVPLTKWRIVPSRLMEIGPLRK